MPNFIDQQETLEKHWTSIAHHDGELRFSAYCDQAKMLVTQIIGFRAVELNDGIVDENGGPFIMTCDSHGTFLGIAMPVIANQESYAYSVLLIPLANAGYTWAL